MVAATIVTSLRERYKQEVRPALQKALAIENPMDIPGLKKIVINMSVNASVDKDQFKLMTDELAKIAGQKPVTTMARKSVSNFKLREGMPIGAKVTLRGQLMYEFLERLLYVVLPRIRDFRGVSRKAFDGRGNYTLGLTEQTLFPEIDPDRVKRTQGMDITIVTSAKNNEQALELLKQLGMPFER
ncbi:MAG TPA: 50S ribosomal protein L5 [Kiritimatiellia bacterium]|nr:50S ribosomal protein L5 [Kiritimatiellia bacterium]HMO98834.1 50S ribosomal protein L5 [Kiritimatiellia bacterium]HMP96218.1 50S ribosomal protein L5 [Kiritimatiellia bacterium]